MTEWNQGTESPRVTAVKSLLTSLEQNDAQYLAGEIDREKWIEMAKGVDDRLAVAGLRLAVRPWAQSSR
jgi:hypothetical protein